MAEQTGFVPFVIDGELHHNLESLYRENVVEVYRRIFARVGNAPDAEDLTEEVFLTVLRWLRLPCARAQAHAYLGATARSVLAEHWRRHYRLETTVFDDDWELPSSPSANRGSPAAVGRVRRILDQLPDTYRAVLELRFMRGYSASEMARELGISSGGARMLQFRALRAAAELETGGKVEA